MLALEYVVKITILIVAAIVIIGLIITFRNNILQSWNSFISSEKPEQKLEPIKGDFNDNEIAKFIEGCWATNKGKNEDVNCYFLMGNFDVTENGILDEIDERIIDGDKIVFEISDEDIKAMVISYDNYHPDVGTEAIVVKG